MGYSFPVSDTVMESFVSGFRGTVQVLDKKPESVASRISAVFPNCRKIEFLQDEREDVAAGRDESDPIGYYAGGVLGDALKHGTA